MTTKLGPAGYAVAIHALITDLLDDAIWVDALHPATVSALESALGACAVEAGDADPIEDADALLLAAGLLSTVADKLLSDRLDSQGELESMVEMGLYDARELVEKIRNPPEEEGEWDEDEDDGDD